MNLIPQVPRSTSRRVAAISDPANENSTREPTRTSRKRSLATILEASDPTGAEVPRKSARTDCPVDESPIAAWIPKQSKEALLRMVTLILSELVVCNQCEHQQPLAPPSNPPSATPFLPPFPLSLSHRPAMSSQAPPLHRRRNSSPRSQAQSFNILSKPDHVSLHLFFLSLCVTICRITHYSFYIHSS